MWNPIPKLTGVFFSPEVAKDADAGGPVPVTKSVPEQVAADERLAGIVRRRFDVSVAPEAFAGLVDKIRAGKHTL